MIRALSCRLRSDGTACRAYVAVMVGECRINGVRIIERADGTLYAQLPNQRDSDGRWFPLIQLPEDVTRQVLDAAMEAYWRA